MLHRPLISTRSPLVRAFDISSKNRSTTCSACAFVSLVSLRRASMSWDLIMVVLPLGYLLNRGYKGLLGESQGMLRGYEEVLIGTEFCFVKT